MAQKSLTVRKVVKRRNPTAGTTDKPANVKKPAAAARAKGKVRRFRADQKTDPVDAKRQLKIQKALYEIADATSAVKDMQSFYKRLHRIVGKLMYAENFVVALYDATTNTRSFPYFADGAGDAAPPAGPVPPQSLFAELVRQPRSLHFNRQQNEQAIRAGQMMGTPAEDFVGVPLVIRKQVIGGIIVQSYLREITYSAEDVRVLEFVANHIATALMRMRATEAEQERAAELAVINSVQEGLASKLDFHSIIKLVGDKLMEIFNPDAFLIGLYNPATNRIAYPYAARFGEKVYDLPDLEFGGFSGEAIRTRRTVVVNENLEQRSAEVRSYTLDGKDDPLSLVYTPIIAGDMVLGVISLQSMTRENAFSESNIKLLETLANALSVALQNAQSFKAEQERVAELQIINSIQQGLAAELDFQAIINLVGDKLREVFKTPNLGISWFDEQANLIHYLYTYEHGKRLNHTAQPPRKGGIFEAELKTRKPIIINNVADALKLNAAAMPGTDQAKSGVVVPIISSDRVLGDISLENYERENAFGESELRLLTTIAASLGTALENARLFDETQRLLKETEQRAAELSIINSVQQGLASKLEMQAIYDLVGDKIGQIFGAQIVTINSFDQERRLRHYHYSVEKGQRYSVEARPMNTGDDHFIRTRQPFLVNENYAEYLAQEFPDVQPFVGELPKSYLSVPLMRGEEVIGYISLQDADRENVFSESDVSLLSTLANSMSVALENARLLDETQRLLKETEQRAAELAIINSVQEGLASKLDMQAIYDLVGEKIHQIFHNTDMDIRIYDPGADLLRFPYVVDQGERITIEPLHLPERGITRHVLQTKETVVINENMAQVHEKFGSTIIAGTQLEKSSIFVPLTVGDQARGLINLSDLYREHAFSESDVRLLQTLANAMSVSLENARLFDETQRLLKETEQRAAELAIINSVQEGLASKLDMQAIYDLVGNKICEIFSLQTCFIMLYDKEKEMEYYPFIVEDGIRQTQEPIPHDDKGFGPLVMRARQPVMINERMIERSAEVESYIIGGGSAPQSAIYVPLLIGSEAKGVISVQNTQRENAFTDSDLRLLTTLASSMSVALESARLFNETERRAAELATVNTVSAALASELDVNALIRLVGEQTRQVFKADITYVALLEDATQMINFPYTYGEDLAPMEYGEGLTSKIIQTGQPLLINSNIDRQTKEIGATVIGKQSLSYLGVPILLGGKAVGVVSVQSTTQEGSFDEDDQRLLSTIAANVGSALHNAQLYREAQESRAVAEQANKAKSTFLANMSHELRTPLNAIIGFTRIVRKKADGVLPAKQLENLDKVLSSSEHLLSLINTVLDIAKIEAGRMDVIPANFSISALMDQCANLAAPLLKSNVKLEKKIDPNASLIYSDQDKIKQIVLNILSNAAKFTHEGKITLAVQRHGDMLDIAVTDTGIGISEEALGRIFEEFQQADNTTTRQYGGTGLGLAISRNLARLLGGELLATSELGQGSTFTLTIPTHYGKKSAASSDVQPDSIQSTQTDAQADSTKKRILVIDDDPDAAYILQESLNQNEYTVLSAQNGHDGLKVAREQQPDAILLDILMPETDGWQVLNDLKSDKATTDIPVVLLTIVDKKALGFKLGAAAYLLKPLDPKVVIEALRRVIGERDSQLKHVLVVDDDPHIAEMLRQSLPESDFALDSAEDGEAGLQAIETERPDVILLDLMMPKLDGFGVIEHLRASSELRNIPIIVISAKELTEEESRKLKESVAFVMKKQGFDSELLKQEINSVVKK